MSEQPTADVPETTPERRAQYLTPDRIESVLADFRNWLYEAAKSGEATGEPERAEPLIDLSTLLGQFAALRHEVNLQTRAVRAQQETNAQTLALLQAASAQTPTDQGDDVARTHARTLLEIYDALALAAREAGRMREAISAQLGSPNSDATPAPQSSTPAGPSFLARLFGAANVPQTIAALQRESESLREHLAESRQRGERVRGLLDSLLTGYSMSLQRLERALRQNELEPMECVGKPFDPERMEALEVVADSGRQPGEVIEEVRRGYMRHGRVFRFAQVRVARNA
jgi:molecular chaperone GrpE